MTHGCLKLVMTSVTGKVSVALTAVDTNHKGFMGELREKKQK